MDFVVTLISTAVKMVFIAAVSFGGIMMGKHLRVRKNAKEAAETEK